MNGFHLTGISKRSTGVFFHIYWLLSIKKYIIILLYFVTLDWKDEKEEFERRQKQNF